MSGKWKRESIERRRRKAKEREAEFRYCLAVLMEKQELLRDTLRRFVMSARYVACCSFRTLTAAQRQAVKDRAEEVRSRQMLDSATGGILLLPPDPVVRTGRMKPDAHS